MQWLGLQMFIVGSSPRLEKAKYPNGRINKLWYPAWMEHCKAVEGIKSIIYSTLWETLKRFILNELIHMVREVVLYWFDIHKALGVESR